MKKHDKSKIQSVTHSSYEKNINNFYQHFDIATHSTQRFYFYHTANNSKQ